MDDVRLDEMGSGGDKLLCLIVTLRCDASFCFHRIVSAVNIHSMLARFACSRASPVNSYGCRPLFFFGVMLWLCSGYALVGAQPRWSIERRWPSLGGGPPLDQLTLKSNIYR